MTTMKDHSTKALHCCQ